MKLKIETTRKETIEVEVDFPFYRQHDVGGDDYSAVIYTRVEFDQPAGPLNRTLVKQYSIHHASRNGQESFEIEIERSGLGGDKIDYTLGRGEYACTREEFDGIAVKAEAFLRLVRGMVQP